MLFYYIFVFFSLLGYWVDYVLMCVCVCVVQRKTLRLFCFSTTKQGGHRFADGGLNWAQVGIVAS